jgi:cysteinyl-tRNA synthetase
VLNIQKAQRYPKVTEHISDIQEMIQTLIDKGSAYERNGSVYFRVSAFEDYGKLAKLKFDEVIEGAGGSGPNDRRGEGDKEDARDFVLWKGETPGTGDSSTVSWDAPFGRGRPGS